MESIFLSEVSLPLQQTAWRPTTMNSNLVVGSTCNWICCYPQGLRCGTIVKGSMQPAIHNTLTREKQLHCGLSPALHLRAAGGYLAKPSCSERLTWIWKEGRGLRRDSIEGDTGVYTKRKENTICTQYIERLQTESVSNMGGCVDASNTHRFLGRKLM
jgi:hypothetical protein